MWIYSLDILFHCDSGELAPEEVTKSLVCEAINANKDAQGFLIEGYPRTMEQVEELNKIVSCHF